MADDGTAMCLADCEGLLLDAFVCFYLDCFLSLLEVDPLVIHQILPVFDGLAVQVLIVHIDSRDPKGYVTSFADNERDSRTADARNRVVHSIVGVDGLNLVPLRRYDVLQMRVVH